MWTYLIKYQSTWGMFTKKYWQGIRLYYLDITYKPINGHAYGYPMDIIWNQNNY